MNDVILKPTGKNLTGVVFYVLMDKKRKEIYAKNLDINREIMMQIFYPIDEQKSNQEKSDYVPQNIRNIIKNSIIGYEKYFEKSNIDDLFVELDSIKINSVLNASMSQKQTAYPVLLFSHGLTMPTYLYTSLLEELASHGYIVVGINHTYFANGIEISNNNIINWDPAACSFNMNTALKIAEEDILFALRCLENINKKDPNNIFTNKMDLNNIGIMGHSFGGTNAINMLQVDDKIKAGISFDAGCMGQNKTKTFNKPFLLFLAETYLLVRRGPTEIEKKTFNMTEESIQSYHQDILNLFNGLENDKHCLVLKNGHHLSFSDWHLLLNQKENLIDKIEAIKIIREVMVDFFDMYLKNKQSTLLKTDSLNKNQYLIKHETMKTKFK